ncbi:MAG: helix-turn-helix transcriptional regulator [Lachnospiraceae bacterium]|nr:helix-turn-helix transcriptional regulator [Lachnospiraceae bacterium]
MNEASENKNDMTTSGLLRVLKASPECFKEKYIGPADNRTFQEYLKDLMEKRGVSASLLIRDSFISKTYFYQFLSGERLPGRDMALRLAFSLHLSVEETQTFLTLAKCGVLYPKIRRDAAILYCLQKEMSLPDSDEYLSEIGEDAML